MDVKLQHFITDELHHSSGSFHTAMLVWRKQLPEEHQRELILGEDMTHVRICARPYAVCATYFMTCGYLATKGEESLDHFHTESTAPSVSSVEDWRATKQFVTASWKSIPRCIGNAPEGSNLWKC